VHTLFLLTIIIVLRLLSVAAADLFIVYAFFAAAKFIGATDYCYNCMIYISLFISVAKYCTVQTRLSHLLTANGNTL